MKFRDLGNGKFFPPIAPDGRIFAVTAGQGKRLELFRLTSKGILGVGFRLNWSEIYGFSYDSEFWKIISRNHRDREMCFRLALPCFMIADNCGSFTNEIQGYPIRFCVMNRIVFEQNKSLPASS